MAIEIVFDQFGIRQEVQYTKEMAENDKIASDAWENSVDGISFNLAQAFNFAVSQAAPLLAALPKESRRRHNTLINEFLGASQRGDIVVSLEILFNDFVPADEVEALKLQEIAVLFKDLPAMLEKIEAAAKG